jgi:hypothetical protein
METPARGARGPSRARWAHVQEVTRFFLTRHGVCFGTYTLLTFYFGLLMVYYQQIPPDVGKAVLCSVFFASAIAIPSLLCRKNALDRRRATGVVPEQPAMDAFAEFGHTEEYEADAPQDRCAICLCSFEPKERVFVMDCSHCYHEACIARWLRMSRRTCPMCRNYTKPRRRRQSPDDDDDDDEREDDQQPDDQRPDDQRPDDGSEPFQ